MGFRRKQECRTVKEKALEDKGHSPAHHSDQLADVIQEKLDAALRRQNDELGDVIQEKLITALGRRSQVTWEEVEKAVALLVEKRQRLLDLQGERDRLQSRLRVKLEMGRASAEQVAEHEAQRDKKTRQQKRLSRLRSEVEKLHGEADAARNEMEAQKEALKAASLQVSAAVVRLSGAEDLLHSQGMKLAATLQAEVRTMRLEKIADLDVVFPIRKADMACEKVPAGPGSALSSRAPKDSMSTDREGQNGAAEGLLESWGLLWLGPSLPPSSNEEGRNQEHQASPGEVADVATRRGVSESAPDLLTRPGASEGAPDLATRPGITKSTPSLRKGANQGDACFGTPMLDSKPELEEQELTRADSAHPFWPGVVALSESLVDAADAQLRMISGVPLIRVPLLRKEGLKDELERQRQAVALGMCAEVCQQCARDPPSAPPQVPPAEGQPPAQSLANAHRCRAEYTVRVPAVYHHETRQLQVVSLVARYAGVTLRYPVQWQGSGSLIRDPHPPASARIIHSFAVEDDVTLPLFPEHQRDVSRCACAMVLLSKDIMQILASFGVPWAVDRHAILVNLERLVSFAISATKIEALTELGSAELSTLSTLSKAKR